MKKAILYTTICLSTISIFSQQTGYHKFYDSKKRATGLKNENGQIIINAKYGDVDSIFHDGLTLVWRQRWYGFCDAKGKEIIPVKYQDAKVFSEGLAAVKKEGGLWGYFDSKGKKKIDFKYNVAGSFSNGIAVVSKYNSGAGIKYGIIDKSGVEIQPMQFDEINPFYEGIAAVKQNGKWGFINKIGKIVVPVQYEQIVGFFEGRGGVKLNGKWGLVDTAGKVVIPITYDGYMIYTGGFLELQSGSNTIVSDKNGNDLGLTCCLDAEKKMGGSQKMQPLISAKYRFSLCIPEKYPISKANNNNSYHRDFYTIETNPDIEGKGALPIFPVYLPLKDSLNEYKYFETSIITQPGIVFENSQYYPTNSSSPATLIRRYTKTDTKFNDIVTHYDFVYILSGNNQFNRLCFLITGDKTESNYKHFFLGRIIGSFKTF